MRLSGCLPVLCTPFDAAGAMDEAAFDAVVDFALECGVDGVVFPGTASEVAQLTGPERAALVARLGARLGARVPFVVGASAATAEETLERIAEGAAAGAACAMVMAPAGIGPDRAAQEAHFAAVGGGSPIPLMLQNAPTPFGAGLAPSDVAAIARAVEAVRYVKEETLPCGRNLQTVLDEAGEAIEGVFGGAGGRFVTGELARGALGTVPAVEIADLHAALVQAWEAGDEAEARRLFAASLPLLTMQAVFRTRLTKEVLRRRGVLAAAHSRMSDPEMDAADLRELGHWLAHLAPDLSVRPVARAAAE